MDVEFLRHQFEDGYDGVVVKNKFKLGVRHLQLTYMLVCAVALGMLRGSTGIAILALNDVTRSNDTYIQVFEWDGRVQGAILSSFLFGYALLLVPIELIMRRVKTGGKHILLSALLASGALTVAMPTIVKRGGWVALCNAQLWMGAAQSGLAPANQALIARFLLPYEKTTASFIVHTGTVLGIIIGFPVSGALSETRLGWELIFYCQAILAFSVACVFGLLTSSDPDKNEIMGDTEKECIQTALSIYRKKALQVPWRSIIKSHYFWAPVCAHTASNAVYSFLLFYTPVYLHTFGMSLKESSWQTALPFLALLIRITTAPTIDWLLSTLRNNFQVNLTYLRKFINAIGACAVVAGLTILPNLTPDWHRLAVTVLVMIMAMMGFQLCGFLETFKDMSDNYHGSLFMISRAVASFIGAFIPVIVGVMLGHDFNSSKRWYAVFLLLAGVYAACNILYTVLGTSDRQYWDGGMIIKDKFGYHNTILDTQLELEELSQVRRQNNDETANNAM